MSVLEDLNQQLRESAELLNQACDLFGESSPYVKNLIKECQDIINKIVELG